MPITLTNENDLNSISLTVESKNQNQTWGGANYSWGQANGTWGISGGTPVVEETKINSISLTNETKL